MLDKDLITAIGVLTGGIDALIGSIAKLFEALKLSQKKNDHLDHESLDNRLNEDTEEWPLLFLSLLYPTLDKMTMEVIFVALCCIFVFSLFNKKDDE